MARRAGLRSKRLEHKGGRCSKVHEGATLLLPRHHACHLAAVAPEETRLTALRVEWNIPRLFGKSTELLPELPGGGAMTPRVTSPSPRRSTSPLGVAGIGHPSQGRSSDGSEAAKVPGASRASGMNGVNEVAEEVVFAATGCRANGTVDDPWNPGRYIPRGPDQDNLIMGCDENIL